LEAVSFGKPRVTKRVRETTRIDYYISLSYSVDEPRN